MGVIKGYWLKDEHKRIREFFETYCKSKNVDPLDPEVWYNIKLKDIIDTNVCFLFFFLIIIIIDFNYYV